MLEQSTQNLIQNTIESASQSPLQKNVAQSLSQNVTENELQSQILTSAYRLKSKLANSKLSLELQDFTTLTIYQRHLSDEDVGKDIHKKVDISDLFHSLSIVKQGSYQLGQIAKFQDVDCFKVQKQGVLTIYVSVFDRTRKREVTFASTITMNQTKNLLLKNEVETLKGHAIIYKQLEQLKIINHRLEQKVVNLTQQIKNCEAKFTQISNENQNMKLQISKKIKKIPFQILVGLIQPKYDQFRLNNYLLQFIGVQKIIYDGYFMFNNVIPQNQQIKFKIKILRSPKKGIAVGITNYITQRARDKIKPIPNQKFQTLYLDSTGKNNFENIILKDLQFKQRDEIETTVNMITKKVSWTINNKVVKSIQKCELLENKNAALVPFVSFTFQNDIVEYII